VDSSIKTLLNESLLADLLNRYGLNPGVRLISDWHAFTFEVQKKDGTPYILRVTHDTHRTKSEIEGELKWIMFLQKQGLPVPPVIPSIEDLILEAVMADKSAFTAVLFEKLNGRPVSNADWNSTLFGQWGSLVGRLHRFSKGPFGTNIRPEWHQSDFLNVEAYIPEHLSIIKRSARELVGSIKALASTHSLAYGLMHADVYQSNFFLSGKDLQLFDFDNCEYGFLVNDIAISLYAALWKLPPNESKQVFAANFLTTFWAQYQKEFRLGAEDLQMLPLFLRLRDVVIYIVARKKLDLNNLNPTQARLLQERGDRIAAKAAVVDVEGILGAC
jgi:amicoumacin kinase